MEIKDRINQIMADKGLNSQQFALKIDVQTSTISHILSGRNNPSLNIVSNILENMPEINPDWLLFGIGNIYRPEYNSEADNGVNISNTSDINEGGVFTNVSGSDSRNRSSVSTSDDKNSFVNTNNAAYTASLPLYTDVNDIDKIIVFYKDNTFEIVKPR